jgi:Lar family restriction alleviation protein
MSLHLESCPFCGGKAEANFIGWSADGLSLTYSLVRCLGCGASGASSTDRAEVIAAWNRRAPVAGPRDEEAGT